MYLISSSYLLFAGFGGTKVICAHFGGEHWMSTIKDVFAENDRTAEALFPIPTRLVETNLSGSSENSVRQATVIAAPANNYDITQKSKTNVARTPLFGR
jgi:hypothetical protein